MLKYLITGLTVAFITVSVGCYGLYQRSQALAADNATLTASLSESKAVNESLLKTVSDNAATRKAISDNVIANEQVRDAIDNSTKQTINAVRKSMKDFPCYETPFPADAVDTICVLQPSNPVCHKN